MTKEVEAESVAYTVCQYFGLDTSDYSFSLHCRMEQQHGYERAAYLDGYDTENGRFFIDSMTEVIQRLMREQPELSLSAMKQAEILIDRVEQERTRF